MSTDKQENWQQELMKYKRVEPTGALSTLGHSAMRAAPEAIANVMLKLGLTNPKIIEEALPRNESYEAGKLQHPLADIAGSAIGFGPLGVETSVGFRAIPAISRAMTRAAPSLLKRTGVHALEAGGIGALYSPPGQEGEGFGLGALIGGALGGPGVSLARNIPNIKRGGRNIANIEELGAQREQALGAHEQQKAIIDALKRQYEEQGAGLQTPESITRQINEKQSALQGLEPTANQPFEPTENLLTEPPISETIPGLEKDIENIKREKSHYLSSEKPHGVEFAEELHGAVSHVKKHIQAQNYDPVKFYAKEAHIKFPRTDDVKQIDEQIQRFLGDKNTIGEASFDKYREAMLKNHKPGHDLVNAQDFIEQWKENRNAANKARRLGFKEGGENQAHWQKEAMRLQDIADKQLAVLKNHLPEKIFHKLAEGDKLWKEHVVPFYGNKIYEQSRPLPNRGKIDAADLLHEIRSNEPGQAKVRELILAHPKLNRLALGHKYAKNPEGLLTASPYEQQFIDKSPSLKGMIERLKKAQFNKQVAEIHQKGQERRFSELEEENKKLKIAQKERLKAQHESKKLEDDILALKQKRKALADELHKGEITQAEFNKLDKEYSEAIENKKSIKSRLKKVGTVGAALYGVYGVSSAISNLMK